MQRHTTVGADLLSGSGSRLVRLAEEIARTHHERWDGSGYPQGLAGEEIPIAGRICAICDVFDALVSARPYKRAWPVERALAEIRAQAGRHFDPRLVERFLALEPYSGVTYAPESPPSTRNVDALT
jgi:putative two-component system response regulator